MTPFRTLPLTRRFATCLTLSAVALLMGLFIALDLYNHWRDERYVESRRALIDQNQMEGKAQRERIEIMLRELLRRIPAQESRHHEVR